MSGTFKNVSVQNTVHLSKFFFSELLFVLVVRLRLIYRVVMDYSNSWYKGMSDSFFFFSADTDTQLLIFLGLSPNLVPFVMRQTSVDFPTLVL